MLCQGTKTCRVCEVPRRLGGIFQRHCHILVIRYDVVSFFSLWLDNTIKREKYSDIELSVPRDVGETFIKLNPVSVLSDKFHTTQASAGCWQQNPQGHLFVFSMSVKEPRETLKMAKLSGAIKISDQCLWWCGF